MGKAEDFLRGREKAENSREAVAAKVATLRTQVRKELRGESEDGPCPSCFQYGCYGCTKGPPTRTRRIKLKRTSKGELIKHDG